MAATIGDVAERAKVSTATVSRVLSGIGRARPETEARGEDVPTVPLEVEAAEAAADPEVFGESKHF